jgi:uncharacterized phage protein gp47/JayE
MLRNQAIQDITTSGVPGLDGLLRNAVLRVLAWVMAGLSYSIYGYVDWIAHEAVPFTATDEYLEAWAALVGIYRKDATAASGSAQFNGQPGTVLPSGAMLQRQDGTPYVTTADGTIDTTGNMVVPIIASITGSITDSDINTPISIINPVPGINSGGFMPTPASGGADQEIDDELRTRMLIRYREPPQGGAQSDYLDWALEVPGVTRAWIDPNGAGAGTVVVYTMFDDVRSADGGFPQGNDGVATEDAARGTVATGDQLLVAEHLYPLQPVTALVWSVAPDAYAINVHLDFLMPDTVDIRSAITAALDDVFLEVGTVGGIIYPSQLYDAINGTPGVEVFVIGSPQEAVQAPAGALPIMGTLT